MRAERWPPTSRAGRRSSARSPASRKLDCGPDVAEAEAGRRHVPPEFEAYVSLAGLIDVAAEIKRLEKQIADEAEALDGTQAKLANENFVIERPAGGGAAAARPGRGHREADRGDGGEPEGPAGGVTRAQPAVEHVTGLDALLAPRARDVARPHPAKTISGPTRFP